MIHYRPDLKGPAFTQEEHEAAESACRGIIARVAGLDREGAHTLVDAAIDAAERRAIGPESTADITLQQAGISERTCNALEEYHGCLYVHELLEISQLELMRTPNFNVKGCEEVAARLEALGYEFKTKTQGAKP